MLNLTSSLPDFIYDSENDTASARPNYNLRDGVKINSVVIHYTVSNRETSLKIFTKGRDVSVHYLIAEDGYLYQTVKEDYQA
jgi:N-acetyl-anhydromuramyl-L-alanine amidase AmpD